MVAPPTRARAGPRERASARAAARRVSNLSRARAPGAIYILFLAVTDFRASPTGIFYSRISEKYIIFPMGDGFLWVHDVQHVYIVLLLASEKIVLSTIQYTLQKGRLGVACNPATWYKVYSGSE